MAIKKACATCGKPSPAPYCEAHAPKPWATSRRAEKVTIPRSQEKARRKRVLEKYLHCCHVCGRVFPAGELEADHVIPLGEGGPDTEENMAPACRPCHRTKTAEESRRARERRKGCGGGPSDPAWLYTALEDDCAPADRIGGDL